jgi:hypothetical protein
MIFFDFMMDYDAIIIDLLSMVVLSLSPFPFNHSQSSVIKVQTIAVQFIQVIP